LATPSLLRGGGNLLVWVVAGRVGREFENCGEVGFGKEALKGSALLGDDVAGSSSVLGQGGFREARGLPEGLETFCAVLGREPGLS
jgi:hypothetical protein